MPLLLWHTRNHHLVLAFQPRIWRSCLCVYLGQITVDPAILHPFLPLPFFKKYTPKARHHAREQQEIMNTTSMVPCCHWEKETNEELRYSVVTDMIRKPEGAQGDKLGQRRLPWPKYLWTETCQRGRHAMPSLAVCLILSVHHCTQMWKRIYWVCF